MAKYVNNYAKQHNLKFKRKSWSEKYSSYQREVIKASLLVDQDQHCAVCFAQLQYYCEVHHKDLNKYNNAYDNLMVVCDDCHKQLHNE